MKNVLIGILSLFVASAPLVAGTDPVPVSTSNVETFASAKVFAASIVEDSDNYAFGGGLSLEVPVVHNLSLEVVGSLFEDDLFTVGSNVIYYVPLSDSFSVYGLGGGAYEFETDQWTVGAGAGVKYALSSQFSLFADGVYNWTVENDDENGVVVARVGVGFSF